MNEGCAEDGRIAATCAPRYRGIVGLPLHERRPPYRRPLLQPLLEMAIASAASEQGQNVGVVLVACADTSPGRVARLSEMARAVFVDRPCVRFAETELAVLVAATEPAAAKSEAADLMAIAKAAGLEAWCGYASLATGGSASEVLAAAEAALALARRVGPGTVIG